MRSVKTTKPILRPGFRLWQVLILTRQTELLQTHSQISPQPIDVMHQSLSGSELSMKSFKYCDHWAIHTHVQNMGCESQAYKLVRRSSMSSASFQALRYGPHIRKCGSTGSIQEPYVPDHNLNTRIIIKRYQLCELPLISLPCLTPYLDPKYNSQQY